MAPNDVEDWIAIQNLVNTYPHAVDRRDVELFKSLWHPDAIWDFADLGCHRGIDEMLAFWNPGGAKHDSHHLMTNVVVTLRGDGTASGMSKAYAQISKHDGETIFPSIVSYEDEYVVYEGRWVFLERHIKADRRGIAAASQSVFSREPAVSGGGE